MTDTHSIGAILKAGGASYGQRHPQGVASVRIVAGLWLAVLGAIFWSRGSYWAALLLPFAVLHLWLAARLLINFRTHH